jgi:predicted nuclease of predicted toxin-antitoxin system
MRFLADMGVSMRVVVWLREIGHDVVHLREQSLHRLPDPAIYTKAGDEGRIVLTFDLDFGEIAAASGRRLPSVVILRLDNPRYHQVIDRLSKVLPSAGTALQSGAIVSIEKTRHRVRLLPIETGGD